MLKRTLLLLSVIFAGSLLVAITVKSDNQMIPSEEVQKMNQLRNKMIESKAIEGQNALAKIPKMLETTPMVLELKKYKQSLVQKNKLMEKVQLKNKLDKSNIIRSVGEYNNIRRVGESNNVRSLGEFNGNSNRDCADCEIDWSAYGSECCDSAWDEYGIDCATLEGTYGWDCSGCSCPGDGDPVCGDGNCTGDETYDSCPDDCNAPGECDAGYN